MTFGRFWLQFSHLRPCKTELWPARRAKFTKIANTDFRSILDHFGTILGPKRLPLLTRNGPETCPSHASPDQGVTSKDVEETSLNATPIRLRPAFRHLSKKERKAAFFVFIMLVCVCLCLLCLLCLFVLSRKGFGMIFGTVLDYFLVPKR